MSRGHYLFRGLMWAILLTPVALIAAWFAFFLLFDFNAHRDDVEAFFARNAPGYRLSLAGKVEVTPWPLRVEVGPGVIYTADNLPVLHWQAMTFELDPARSLRSGRWHFNEIALIAPSLRWFKRRQGDNTVSPLLHHLFDTRKPLQIAHWLAPRHWQVDSFQVVEGRIRWKDARDGREGTLRHLQVQLSELVPGKPALGAVSWEMQGPRMAGRVDFQGNGVLKGDVLHLLAWSGGIALKDPRRRQAPAYWTMEGQQASLNLKTLAWQAMNMTVRHDDDQWVQLRGKGRLLSERAAQLWLKMHAVDLPEWIVRWGGEWPSEWRDPAWRRVGGEVALQWSAQRVSAQFVPLRIGPAQVEGGIVLDHDPRALNMRLSARHVALRWAVEKESPEPERAQEADAAMLSVPIRPRWLAQSVVQGSISLRAAQIQGLAIERGDMTLLPVRDGQLTLAPFDFETAEGRWFSQLAVESSAPWRWRWKGQAEALDTAAWLKKHRLPARLSGTATVRFDIQGAGVRRSRFTPMLSGRVRVKMADGGALNVPAPLGGPFSNLESEARLDKGRVRLETLRIERDDSIWQGSPSWSLTTGRATGILHQEWLEGRRDHARYRLQGTLRQLRLQPIDKK